MNFPKKMVPAMKQYDANQVANINFTKPLTDKEKYDRINTINSNGQRYIQFYIETKFYYQTQNIYSDCNTITFFNLGANTVLINGFPLTQGQQLTIEGNYLEIDQTQYQIEFSISISPNNNLAVLRKLYK
jgi:hypothetical protein